LSLFVGFVSFVVHPSGLLLPMLPGISGSLVSGYFAEQILPGRFAGETGEEAREHGRAALRRWHRMHAASLGPVSTARVVFDLAAAPIAGILGYRSGAPHAVGKGEVLVAPLHLVAEVGKTTCRASPCLPILLVAAWGEDLDGTWRDAVRQSAGAGAAWCFSTNGIEVRLVDTRRSHARRHLAFTLDALLEDGPAFATFWALSRPAAFLSPAGEPRTAPAGEPPTGELLPLIERVVLASALETVAVCRGLKAGVLDALGLLLAALAPDTRRPSGRRGLSPKPAPDPAGLFEQALTLVYRVLFLLFAESRELLPTWHPVYRDSYSMEAVRSLAERAGPARGLWETLQAISRLSHAGCHAGNLTVTPFNGRLFSPALTPAGELPGVDDDTARQVILALCTSGHGSGRARDRITYRDLGVEQLGSVYESVLDYRVVAAEGRLQLEPGAGVRKSTGTFYTPQSITRFLVRRTLSPLVADASPEAILDLRVVDPAMGSGAFLVAACQYLAGAYEGALVRHARCRPGDVGDRDRRSFRRLVASRCLYGVDLNPMAVQLARLSLWLSTLAPDRPLTFLDHRLLVGNSLVGASLDDVARRPDPGRAAPRTLGRDAPLLSLVDDGGPGPALRAVLPARTRLACASDDTVAVVREKEALLASLNGGASALAPWRQVADAWCALGLGIPSGKPGPVPAGLLGELADHVRTGRCALPAGVAASWLDAVRASAAEARFFHWTLEFPEVFFGPDGSPRPDAGFDAVIGNPPWDMLRADNPRTEGANQGAAGDLVRFARRSGLYRALGNGHANSFQLFLERALRIVRRGGRVGMVLPWGLASDTGCAPLRRLLFDTCTLDPLHGFDNTASIFPIHRSVRFLLLTASAAGQTEALPCRIGERDAAVLDSLPDQAQARPDLLAPVTLTRDLLRRLSGDDLAIPDVRSPADLTLLEKLVAVAPPLGSAGGWAVEFGRELNATDDRRHFTRDPRDLAVLEGKHVQPFRALDSVASLRLPLETARALYARTGAFLRPRLAYRDVASATNRLTLIAAVVPAGVATLHTLFCQRGVVGARDQWFLCGVLNSFVANYLVRLRVTTHVTAGILARLPVPRPAGNPPVIQYVADMAKELSSLEQPEESELYARLQGAVAALYGLTAPELAHVLGTFPLIGQAIRDKTMASFVDLLSC
jgi:hypothetical protein